MNIKEVEEWATFSLDRKTRSGDEAQGGKSMISKFGVGAKHAGFYLGEQITIFTKRKESSKVLEFTLSETKMDEAYSEGRKDSVFTAPLFEHNAHDMEHSLVKGWGPKPKPIMDQILEHHKRNDQFCIVIIALRSAMVDRLIRDEEKDLRIIPYELANIYHFYLNPNHTPNRLVNNFKQGVKLGSIPSRHEGSARNGNSSKVEGDFLPLRPIKSEFQPSVDFKKVPPRITLNSEYLRDTTQKVIMNCDLSTLRSSVSEIVNNAAAAFRFDIALSDIDSGPETLGMSQELASLGGGSELTHIVQGILFYYPFDGKETRPSGRIKYKCPPSVTVLDDAYTDEDERELYEGVPDTDIESGESHTQGETHQGGAVGSVFSVFWSDRLVPETKLKSLSFFPKINKLQELVKKKIPGKWHSRLKGFLFFDHRYEKISNNKLKILSNLELLLNSEKSIGPLKFTPRNPQDDMLKWIQACHKNLDKEFRFFGRNLNLEKVNFLICIDCVSNILLFFLQF